MAGYVARSSEHENNDNQCTLTINPGFHKNPHWYFCPGPSLDYVGIRLRELSELGPLAACVLKENREPFIAWLGDGRLLTVNPRFEELTGYSRDELGGMRWPDDFTVPDTRDVIKRAMGGRGDDEVPGCRGEIRKKDGTGVDVAASVHQYCQEPGGEPCYFAFLADLTERKKELTALLEAQAQAELLLDLMSHDIDNMQRVSIRYLELALGTARLRPGERELIMTALGSLMNASRIIDNVRRVSDRDRPDFP